MLRSLSAQQVRPFGASLIGAGLRQNLTLTELTLTRCELGPAGAMAIAKAVQDQHARTVRSLDVSWNEIEDDGAVAIARMIGSVKGLLAYDMEKKRDAVRACWLCVMCCLPLLQLLAPPL